jgi:hypothetical protein
MWPSGLQFITVLPSSASQDQQEIMTYNKNYQLNKLYQIAPRITVYNGLNYEILPSSANTSKRNYQNDQHTPVIPQTHDQF